MSEQLPLCSQPRSAAGSAAQHTVSTQGRSRETESVSGRGREAQGRSGKKGLIVSELAARPTPGVQGYLGQGNRSPEVWVAGFSFSAETVTVTLPE